MRYASHYGLWWSVAGVYAQHRLCDGSYLFVNWWYMAINAPFMENVVCVWKFKKWNK